jgi:hypothetical protein
MLFILPISRIEGMLWDFDQSDIVVGTLQFGEILKVQRLEREKQHRRWEEEWRLQEMEEEARKKEEAKERAFRADVRKWTFAKCCANTSGSVSACWRATHWIR